MAFFQHRSFRLFCIQNENIDLSWQTRNVQFAFPFSSLPYRIARIDLGRVGAVSYVRSFWWFLVGIPISGFLILLLMNEPIPKMIGIMFLLWPLTIPGRIILVSWKTSKKILAKTVATFTEDAILLLPEDGIGTRINNQWIRKIWIFGDIWVIEGPILKFVLIRRSAFTPEATIEIDEYLCMKGWLKKTKLR